jgi:hypothetical protein
MLPLLNLCLCTLALLLSAKGMLARDYTALLLIFHCVAAPSIVPPATGTYRIQNADSGMYLDLEGSVTSGYSIFKV